MFSSEVQGVECMHLTVRLVCIIYTLINKQNINTAGKACMKFLLVFWGLCTCFGFTSHHHDL